MRIREPNDISVVSNTAPGLCMIDTGCAEAVGGRAWHRDLQRELIKMNKEFYREEMYEAYQFGPGRPIIATTRWVYPDLGILGTHQQLCMAEVDADVPGLVGPDEMRQWRLATEWDSERGDAISIRDHTGTHRGPAIWGPRRHPVVDLMDYGGEGTQVFAAHPVNGDDDHNDNDDSDSGDDPDDADSDN